MKDIVKDNHTGVVGIPKLSKLDFFAAYALQGLLAMEANPQFGTKIEPYHQHGRDDLLAISAYTLAKEMVKEGELRMGGGHTDGTFGGARARVNKGTGAKEPKVEIIKHSLTAYGMLVRSLRIVSETTLKEMSDATSSSVAYLASLEIGAIKPTHRDIMAAHKFFKEKGAGVHVKALKKAAEMSVKEDLE